MRSIVKAKEKIRELEAPVCIQIRGESAYGRRCRCILFYADRAASHYVRVPLRQHDENHSALRSLSLGCQSVVTRCFIEHVKEGRVPRDREQYLEQRIRGSYPIYTAEEYIRENFLLEPTQGVV